MSSTGGKTSAEKLDSLALSMDHLVYRYPQVSKTASRSSASCLPNDYAQRLEREHTKVLGAPEKDHPIIQTNFLTTLLSQS